MQQAADEANRTIAVLSQKYLESTFTQPEWAATFAQDPQGKKQKLIPISSHAGTGLSDLECFLECLHGIALRNGYRDPPPWAVRDVRT